MANLTLAQMRAQVRERLHLTPADTAFPDNTINRALSKAASDLGGAQPNGWWFQRVEITRQNTAGDLAIVPVVPTTTTLAVQKIGYVFASLDGDYWVEIKERERLDAIRAAGGRITASGLPYSWSQVHLPAVAGVRRQIGLAFDPSFPNLAWTRVGAVLTGPDFAADGDALYWLPAPFAYATIEGACRTLGRQKRKVGQLMSHRRLITEVTMADAAAEGWDKVLRRWFDKPYHGPGYATQHRRI